MATLLWILNSYRPLMANPLTPLFRSGEKTRLKEYEMLAYLNKRLSRCQRPNGLGTVTKVDCSRPQTSQFRPCPSVHRLPIILNKRALSSARPPNFQALIPRHSHGDTSPYFLYSYRYP